MQMAQGWEDDGKRAELRKLEKVEKENKTWIRSRSRSKTL